MRRTDRPALAAAENVRVGPGSHEIPYRRPSLHYSTPPCRAERRSHFVRKQTGDAPVVTPRLLTAILGLLSREPRGLAPPGEDRLRSGSRRADRHHGRESQEWETAGLNRLARRGDNEATMQRRAASSIAATPPGRISRGTSTPVVSACGLNHRLASAIPSG